MIKVRTRKEGTEEGAYKGGKECRNPHSSPRSVPKGTKGSFILTLYSVLCTHIYTGLFGLSAQH